MSGRLRRLRLNGGHQKITIKSLQCLTEANKKKLNQNLLKNKTNCINSIPNFDIKIIIDDFNAKVGDQENFRPTNGNYSRHNNSNENGLKLIEIANEQRID